MIHFRYLVAKTLCTKDELLNVFLSPLIYHANAQEEKIVYVMVELVPGAFVVIFCDWRNVFGIYLEYI